MAAKSKKGEEKEVIHPEVEAVVRSGDTPITVEDAKEFLGWQEEGEEDKFGSEYLLTDLNGAKVRCTNNLKNRPLYLTNVDSLKQEMLNQRWRLNGEPIIIGRHGTLGNGQHTLVALVLAEQERTVGENASHWKKLWKEPVSIDKIVVVGVDEDDDVFNTMDTCKPRSLTDVFYRSLKLPKGLKPSQAKTYCTLAAGAVSLVWGRTGASDNGYAPRRTHAEALDFLSRHHKITECVKHIWEENSDGGITAYVPPGRAAGLAYLMAASASTDEQTAKYKKTRRESALDFSMLDKACEFWTLLGKAVDDFKPVREALGRLGDPDSGEKPGIHEKTGVLVRAWEMFSAGQEFTKAGLKLKFKKDEWEVWRLVDEPLVCGIDEGEVTDKPEPAEVEEDAPKTPKGKPVVLDEDLPEDEEDEFHDLDDDELAEEQVEANKAAVDAEILETGGGKGK